jgi:hypothetical protein
MAKMTFNRNDIGSLCERLENRGTSVVLKDRPEVQGDMRNAAAILRFFLARGIPPSPIEIEMEAPQWKTEPDASSGISETSSS